MKLSRVITALCFLTCVCASAVGQVKTFHNIPYAHAARYESPVMSDGWDKTADYSKRGPQCPQTKTGNDMFMAGNLPWSEDCLVLSINTPSMSGKLPVVVFIHGGSHHHGSGEWGVYDCSELAREQNVVTVSMSFRHGVFGYLYDGQRGNSSLGYEDQVTALKWLQKNISDFGGDPDNITLTGQSAGAQSVVFLVANLDEKLFRRAIAFSAPFLLNQSSAKARSNAEKFATILGKDLNDTSAEELIEAEKKFKKEVGGGAMAFSPSGFKQYGGNVKSGVEDVVVTWQQHDGSMFVMNFKDKEIEDFGDKSDMRLTALVTNMVFRNGAERFARCLRRQGINAIDYEFTWSPPGANWKAAHGLEIAFLYGSKEYILGYGLAGNVDEDMYDGVCASFRKTVADFARTGVWKCEFGLEIK